MSVVCIEVFKRYILNMPTAWIFDARQHAVRHAVHAVRRLHAGAERPCPRRLPLLLDAAAHPGDARPRALHRVLPARHRRAGLCRLRLRRGLLAHRRAFQRHRGRPAGLPFQVGDPDRRRADHAAGRRRDRALRRLPEDRRMAEPAQGRRRDRRGRGAARAQRICRRGIAQDRDRGRAATSTKWRGSAAWAETCNT